jgi:wyosine [tRNA(Phe)-imidazoG37] synthetase (radical SAM superfamily)
MSKSFIYGPVPSRRLGLSLGVDLVPYKVCSYNCIYCQIGLTPETTILRKPYIPADEIISQLTAKLNEGIAPDYITLGGSGEPTLNSDIGAIIDRIKSITDIPVAVLTNGGMLYDPSIRASLALSDVILPSFDACDESMFYAINRPHAGISFNEMADGLIAFRKEYSGPIWLEIFIVEGINDTQVHMEKFARWIEKIQPDKVHVNTAVRPAVEKSVKPVLYDKLQILCRILGPRAEVIVPFDREGRQIQREKIDDEILNMLSRRPCTIADLATGLGVSANEVIKHTNGLLSSNLIETVQGESRIFFQRKIIVSDDQAGLNVY